MDEIFKIAGDAGLSKDQAETATGGIMSLVKKSLESGDYNKILQSIPQLEGVVSKHEEEAASRAGGNDLMGSAMSMMNSFGGAGGQSAQSGQAAAGAGGAASLAGLFALLQKQGIGMKEIQKFLPLLATLLKGKSGVDISSILGLSGSTTAQSQPQQQQQSGFNAGNLMGSLFGK